MFVHMHARVGNLCIIISSSVMPTLLVVTLSGKAWSVLRVQRQLPRGTRNGGKVIPGRGHFMCKGPSSQEAASDLMRLKHWGIMF